MKYFKIINACHEGRMELNIPPLIHIQGEILDDRITVSRSDDVTDKYGFFISPDDDKVDYDNFINKFLYVIGFKDQNTINKFCENVLGYNLGNFLFPETKTIEDLFKLLEALENYYDKNNRPTR